MLPATISIDLVQTRKFWLLTSAHRAYAKLSNIKLRKYKEGPLCFYSDDIEARLFFPIAHPSSPYDFLRFCYGLHVNVYNYLSQSSSMQLIMKLNTHWKTSKPIFMLFYRSECSIFRSSISISTLNAAISV